MTEEEKRDQECLRLGREMLRMIGELQMLSQDETGYSRRQFTFRGGAVYLLLVKDEALVDTMERAVQQGYAVAEATPPRALN